MLCVKSPLEFTLHLHVGVQLKREALEACWAEYCRHPAGSCVSLVLLLASQISPGFSPPGLIHSIFLESSLSTRIELNRPFAPLSCLSYSEIITVSFSLSRMKLIKYPNVSLSSARSTDSRQAAGRDHCPLECLFDQN